MTDELAKAGAALVRRLLTLAAQDDGLRAELRTLAELILAETETNSLSESESADSRPPACPEDGVPDAPPIADSQPQTDPQTPASPPVAGRVPTGPLPELTLGRSIPPGPIARPEVPTTVRLSKTEIDLPALAARCRLKAEGLRWAVLRDQKIAQGADFRLEVAPHDREILGKARELADCHLWMNTPDFAVPREPILSEDVAGCFEALANAVELVEKVSENSAGHREVFEQALGIMAEAQSALRVAILRIDGPADSDQFRAYDWLRITAAREQIYIRHHMRITDPAEPGRRSGLAPRIAAVEARLDEGVRKSKQHKARLGRLRYHAKLIGEGNGGEHDWQKVMDTVNEMVADGLPPSSRDIREVLLPILDHLPEIDEAPRNFDLALREIDRYLAGRTVPAEVAAASGEPPTPEVAEVARLLEGRSMVLIGGDRRPAAYDALKRSFGLKDFIWIETREHESIAPFEPYVARPDVALVIVAIRWSSHSYSDVKQFCQRYDKPLVRLPAGYNPNQVASQILRQCSGQLEPVP